MQRESPDRSQVLQLVLASAQQEPIELDRSVLMQRGRDGRIQRPLPRLIRRRFEAVQQLEAGLAEVADERLGGFDSRRGVPGCICLGEVDGGHERRLVGGFAERTAHRGKDLVVLLDRKVADVTQGGPVTQADGRSNRPSLTGERTQRPRHLARALGQPDQNAFADDIAWGWAGAQVDRRSFGLNTSVKVRRALTRFQALRPQILWFGRITERHIVP